MSANSNPNNPCHYVAQADRALFKQCTHIVRFVTTAVHEVIGHGTGKLFSEISPGRFNFDKNKPPIHPLTLEPIDAWYILGQTWTSVFEDIATTVEECRAMLVSQYLVHDERMLTIFGYDSTSGLTSADCKWNFDTNLPVLT